MKNLLLYSKSIVHFFAFVGVAAASVFDDGKVSGVAEWCLLATALANAVVVLVVPEMSKGVGAEAKTVAAIVIAAAGIVPTLAVDGWSSQDAWQVLLVAIAAVATPIVSNPGYARVRRIAGPVPPVRKPVG